MSPKLFDKMIGEIAEVKTNNVCSCTNPPPPTVAEMFHFKNNAFLNAFKKFEKTNVSKQILNENF